MISRIRELCWLDIHHAYRTQFCSGSGEIASDIARAAGGCNAQAAGRATQPAPDDDLRAGADGLARAAPRRRLGRGAAPPSAAGVRWRLLSLRRGSIGGSRLFEHQVTQSPLAGASRANQGVLMEKSATGRNGSAALSGPPPPAASSARSPAPGERGPALRTRAPKSRAIGERHTTTFRMSQKMSISISGPRLAKYSPIPGAPPVTSTVLMGGRKSAPGVATEAGRTGVGCHKRGVTRGLLQGR
jgi:hypothetical protein